MAGKALKIVALPVDRGGCGFLRVRQPLEMVKQHTDHDTYVVGDNDDGDMIRKALMAADVAVIRQGGEGAITAFKQIPELKHLRYVLDIDDNVELISPYSEHYKEYGLHDFQDKDSGVWIWKDGEQGFDLKHNRSRILSVMQGLRDADLVTVTTDKLADYAKTFNKNVGVLPNCVDHAKWWPVALKPTKSLRVGWSGGISHYEDWYTIKEPLNKLLRKHQFTLVSIGASFPGLIDDDLKHLIESHPWVPFEAHSWHMMCMGLDIAIIPLADLPFNQYKSSIKFYEMSALGIPSLVSNVLPYRHDIKHNETAYAYGTANEFYLGLTNLLLRERERQRLAVNSRKWVKAQYDAKENAHLWPDAYLSLF